MTWRFPKRYRAIVPGIRCVAGKNVFDTEEEREPLRTTEKGRMALRAKHLLVMSFKRQSPDGIGR
jgi:hypothetical protein